MTNVTLVIFGSDWRFFHAKNRLAEQARQSGWFKKVIVYDDTTAIEIAHRFGAPEQIKKQLEQHETHLSPQYFWWKPGVVLKAILDECDENDILLYMDAGCSLNYNGKDRFKYYVNLCQTGPGFVGFGANKLADISFPEFPFEKMHTKRDVLKYFNMDEPEILLSSQISSGAMFFKKNKFSLSIIEDWQKHSKTSFLFDNEPSVNNDEYPEFVDHRHDQSILSLLIKSRWNELENCLLPNTEIAIDHDPNLMYPIKATRIRDDDMNSEKWL